MLNDKYFSFEFQSVIYTVNTIILLLIMDKLYSGNLYAHAITICWTDYKKISLKYLRDWRGSMRVRVIASCRFFEYDSVRAICRILIAIIYHGEQN